MSRQAWVAASPPGPVTPERDEALAVASGEGFEEQQGERVKADCAAAADRKRLATLRALLALQGGHVVHELADGGFLVTWRGLSRDCRDLAELEAHARRVGAVR